MTTKFEHWKYEEEVRVFKRASDCTIDNGKWYSEFGDAMELVGIVHGPLCNLSEKKITSVLPKGKTLNITKARLAFKSFSVVKNQVIGVRVVEGNA